MGRLAGFDSKLAAACPNSTIGTGLAIAGTDAQDYQESVRNVCCLIIATLWAIYEAAGCKWKQISFAFASVNRYN